MTRALRCRALLILAVVAVSVTAGAASAQAATEVARGNDPDAVVDRDGITHLVWNESHPESGVTDVLHYCQIPRGASACTNAITRSPPTTGGQADTADIEGPHVMVTPFGEVILLTNRNFENLAYVSEDGGATFPTTPTSIGTVGASYTGDSARALFDGADRRVVTIAGPTGGIRLQGAPIADPNSGSPQTRTTAYASLSNYNSYNPSVVQRGKGSFVAAWADANGTSYVRTFDCTAGPPTCPTADLNNAAKWTPQVAIANAELPRLVSGPTGTFVIYRSTEQGATYRQYVIRRIDGTAIGAASPVSEPAVGAPSRDMIEDESGVIHALYVGSGNTISYRTSADAKTFGDPQILQGGPDFTLDALRVAARTVDDGFTGFGFWESQPGGQTNPPILGISLPEPSVSLPHVPVIPTDPGTGTGTGTAPPSTTPTAPLPPAACRVLSFAAVDVIADACLQRDGDAYVATGGVKVNGLRIELGSGKLRLEPKNRRITSSGATVTLKAGDTVLYKSSIDWTLPKGSVADVGRLDVDKFGGDLIGFPLKGSAELKFRGGGAELPIHLALPAVFGGVTGDVTLRADNLAGVHLRELHVKVGDALIGPLEVKGLFFDYDADKVSWAGGAKLILPPQPPGPSLDSSVGFSHGDLDFFKGELTLPGAGLPLDPFSVVYLHQIRFSLQATPPPLKLTGGITLTAGPTIAKVPAVAINGNVAYTFPDAPKPAILRVDGDVSLVKLPLSPGSAYFELRTNGYVAFGGHLGLQQSGFGVTADLSGVLFGSKFNVRGKASVCLGDLGCASGDVVVSSTGFAACVQTFAANFGAGYLWDDGLDIMLKGCDVGRYETKIVARGAQAGAPQSVRFAAGLPSGFVAVQGQGAPPHVVLAGPGGARIDSGAGGKVQTAGALAFHDAANATTYFVVKKPAAGVWTVAPEAGSAPVVKVQSADGLAQPSVRASVARGRGATRVLRYAVKPIPGQQVSFVEQGHGAARPIGTAKGSRGTLRFTPASGPGGTRRIVALVSSYGAPRSELRVATYVAPPPARPAAITRLKARRTGTRLVVSWAKAADARSYEVRATLSDGRKLLSLQRATKLAIPAVASRTRATIEVRGVQGDATRGRAAELRVAAKKARAKKKR